jgi:hypothetical protein
MTMRGLFLCAGLSMGGAACTHASAHVLGDTMAWDQKTKTWSPLVEYKAPDIDELTGMDSDDDATEATPAPATPPPAAPAPAAPAKK